MKKMICFMMVFLFSLMFINACGPSEEAIATMTASAWTPTPEPTLTPIPLPYDLEVTLEDESGKTVTMAYVEVKELETDASAVDDTGSVEFLDLPGEEITLVISAQGYNSVEETITLERGMNTKSYSMLIDPLQIHPSEACQEGQKIIYIEDYEDGIFQDWEGISRPVWEFEDLEGRGKVLTYAASNTEFAATNYAGRQDLENMVWKMDMLNGGDVFFNMVHYEKNYLIRFSPTIEKEVQMMRIENEEHTAFTYRSYINIGDWEKIAIAYYENALEFWINDELYLALDDPDPLGPLGISFYIHPTGSATSIDNMVICELTEPYAPPVSEENVD